MNFARVDPFLSRSSIQNALNPPKSMPSQAHSIPNAGARPNKPAQKISREEEIKQEKRKQEIEFNEEIKKISSLTKPQFRKWLKEQVEVTEENDEFEI